MCIRDIQSLFWGYYSDNRLYSNQKNKYKNIFETIGLFQELPEDPICAFLEHDDGIDCSEAPEKESEMSGRKYSTKKQKKCDGKKKKKVIDHSIIEKNHGIGEREPVTGIDSEFPAETEVTTNKLNPKTARKNASCTQFIAISIPMHMEDMTQEKETGMSEGNASEEPPMSSKRGYKKRKVNEREKAVDHSMFEKIHYIDEEEPVTETDSERDVTQTKESEKSSQKYASEKLPMTSKCDGEKKNVEENVSDIYSENPAKSKDQTESVSVAGYDIENLPKGWDRRIIIRKTGKTAGQVDIYFYSPDGIKLRSRRDIAAYLARTKSDLKIDDFDFSKKSISSNCAVKLIPSEEETAPTKLKSTLGKKMKKRRNSSLKNPFRKKTVNHTCETIRLLQELQEDPVCACHEQDDDDSSEASSENDFNDFPSLNTSKPPSKSKQLIIYNDKGCMKGVEIGKGSVTNDSKTLLREMTMKEPYVLIKTKIDPESHDYSSNSTIPTTSSFSYNPEVLDITDSDTGDTINLMSQAFPQYALAKTFKGKKKRGRPRKGSANKDPSRINVPRSNRRSVPYTNSFLGQQSYTQVSFEEVHLAQPKKARGRPHKSNSNKPSREMLILKRKIQKKIVHNRGFEYPSAGIPKHYRSNINEGHSFNGSPQSKQIVKAADQSSKQLVKKRATRYPNAQEKYGPELLPPGWDTAVITRKSGKSAGQVDVYFITPEGKRVRSKQELTNYIEKNNLPLLPEEFIFRKSAYRSKLPMIEYNKDSS